MRGELVLSGSSASLAVLVPLVRENGRGRGYLREHNHPPPGKLWASAGGKRLTLHRWGVAGSERKRTVRVSRWTSRAWLHAASSDLRRLKRRVLIFSCLWYLDWWWGE